MDFSSLKMQFTENDTLKIDFGSEGRKEKFQEVKERTPKLEDKKKKEKPGKGKKEKKV